MTPNCYIVYQGKEKDCTRTKVDGRGDPCTASYLDEEQYKTDPIPLDPESAREFAYEPWMEKSEIPYQEHFELSSSERDRATIEGTHGRYDISKGYFFCPDDIVSNNSIVDIVKSFQRLKALEKQGFLFQKTRAMIYTITLYDVATEFLVNINVVLEVSAAGFNNPVEIEVTPFKMPFEGEDSAAHYVVLSLRILLVFWLTLVILATLVSTYLTPPRNC